MQIIEETYYLPSVKINSDQCPDTARVIPSSDASWNLENPRYLPYVGTVRTSRVAASIQYLVGGLVLPAPNPWGGSRIRPITVSRTLYVFPSLSKQLISYY